MKKLFFLFNETTVVDFPFIWNLFKRYYLIPIIVFIIANPIGYIFYITQNEIYMAENVMTNTSIKQQDAFSDIGNLLGQNTNQLTDIELVITAKQWKTRVELSKKIVEMEDFENMVFSSISGRTSEKAKDMFKGCGTDKTCLANAVAKRIDQFYGLDVIKENPGKIKINSYSFDRKTTIGIITSLQKSMEELRMKDLKDDFLKKISMLEELTEKERKNLHDRGIFSLNEDSDRYSSKLDELKNAIIENNKYLSEYNLMLVSSESKLKYIKNIKGHSVNSQKQIDIEKIRTLKQQILDLRQNLSILNENKNKSSEDIAVINQISKQIADLSKELEKYGDTNMEDAYIGERDFASTHERSSNYIQLDHRVIRDKIQKLQEEQKSLLAEQKQLLDEKVENLKKRADLEPQINYLKLLESKLASSKLLESTIVADVKFEEINPHVSVFRRVEILKIFIFTNLICFLIAFAYIVFRFLHDDKIYDHSDIKHHFNDLQIIGNAPDFD